ncbi:MAG: protease-like activity factor CPAF [Elusimicrobia bacterium]|nr:protease-like activity factor CPAF [Elusimicrobiota bacterium]
MLHRARSFFAAALSLFLFSNLARAAALDEAQALSQADPADYANVYDKDLASATLGSQPQVTQAELKQMMLSDLDSVRAMIAARYAPAGWKKEQYGWDLDAQVQKAKDQINSSAAFGVKDYQLLLKNLLNSMKDYHVSVSFHSTELAMLPLSVTEAGGRYFISGINRKALPENVFPFKAGDEVVSFDGKPVAEAVAELNRRAGVDAVPGTDAAMAAMLLTVRSGTTADAVPQGPVSIGIKPAAGGEAVQFPLKWLYSPEFIAPQPFVTNKGAQVVRIPMSWLGLMMVQTLAAPGFEQASYGLGNKDGFLPDFGEKTWSAPADNGFRAYVYKSAATGRNIGFVRIPTYMVSEPAKMTLDFINLVEEFNKRADALVIDGTNNPGGIVLYLYALASTLTDRPLAVPQHYISLTQSDVAEAINFIKQTAGAKTDQDAQAMLGPDVAGYRVDLELLQNWTGFYLDTVKQWNAGRTITTPLPPFGIAAVKPAPGPRYTKPLLILTNPLDFSGGDFFPAIMQDNKRAVIFGERTAGAGGVVKDYKRENNLLGVETIKLTATIAQRADGSPIENLGVKPDVPYAVTPADVQNGYADYIKAADAAVNALIK